MKRFTLSLLILLSLTTGLFAGGIVTNSNQSAMFVRMLARDASTDIDAVYYNPAALALFEDGLYLSINNQVIGKTNKVSNDYYLLNNNTFDGKIMAPVFPGIYAAYKKGKWAYSLGINPIGGGGGATYDKGFADIETRLAASTSDMATAFSGIDVLTQSQGMTTNYDSITDYRYATFNAEGKEVRIGVQAGVSYALTEYFSVFAGARYVIAPASMNTSKMELTGVEYYSEEKKGWYSPDKYMEAINADLSGAFGGDIFDENALKNAKIDDVYGDVSFSGSGYTPMLGFNLKLAKGNIGVKYEHLTRMSMKTVVNDEKNAGGTYINNKEKKSDMPPMFTIGANYQVIEKLTVSGSFRHYWDFDSDYGYQDVEGQRKFITKNTWEVALGAEYQLLENLVVSAGFQRTQFSPSQYYQVSSRNALSNNTIAFGGTYGVSETVNITLGAGFAMYSNFTKDYDGNGVPRYYNPGYDFATETYDKSAWMIGLGADFRLGN